ncbi:prephenate dehydrogenase [Cutibacterium sp.]|uniref:prephenate dehydrogenase n=1 Tax=Cutibacterium sp. TaxID=1912221 RepID=UPI0025904A3D|nr:prephenate dehydrogenase [Cutibacterium sp.]MCA3773266.1 prephenate dehydrogenase [Cutibacterium sp.]
MRTPSTCPITRRYPRSCELRHMSLTLSPRTLRWVCLTATPRRVVTSDVSTPRPCWRPTVTDPNRVEPTLTGPVLIVGVGLIGASIGKALMREGTDVHLWDIDRDNSLIAAGHGAGRLGNLADDAYRMIVIATPPAVVAQTVVERLTRHPQAVVTDTASVKGAVLAELTTLATEHEIAISRYVGSHPMAGTQCTGPLTASTELFVDRTWVVAPRTDNRYDDVQQVVALARACGARVVSMDAHEHDRAVAEVSHLPHLMSILTAANLRRARPEHLSLAGPGIRDVTRIARSQTAMWRQILSSNCVEVRSQLEAIRDDLDDLLSRLNDSERLEEFLSVGQAGARKVAGKHGHQMVETTAVVVEIPDTPGALARLFADVEAAGINIEDLSVEHNPARETGFLSIDVAPSRAEQLTASMRNHGWSVRS